MKKAIYILGIICSIIIIAIAVYIFINVYFIFSIQNGQMFDGFGFPYLNDKPSSPFTLLSIVGLMVGLFLLKLCKKKLKGEQIYE